MTKMAIAAVVLVALLAIAAQATSFRTIVTVEEENQRWPWEQGTGSQQQKCQRQVSQQIQQLQSCGRHLLRGTPFGIDMVVNQQQQQQEQQQHLKQCCQGLKNIGPECTCQALNEVVKEIFRQFGQGGSQQGGQGESQQGGQEESQQGGSQEGQQPWGQGGQGQQQPWGQGGQWQPWRVGEQVKQILERAREIPQECNIGVQCRIDIPW